MTLANPHATLLKFGYPHTLLHEGEHWAVLVRPAQPTFGSLVLCATGNATAYSELPAAAFAEQGLLIGRIERWLNEVVRPEKINYLMLMMVDPQVHFHILPRYKGVRTHGPIDYVDRGWPALPNLAECVSASADLIRMFNDSWKRSET